MKKAEGFIKKVKYAVVGEKNCEKIIRNLRALGFEVKDKNVMPTSSILGLETTSSRLDVPSQIGVGDIISSRRFVMPCGSLLLDFTT